MSDYKELEARLNAALVRIARAIDGGAAAGAAGGAASAELQAENARLRESLRDLSAQRQADIEKLDGLIAQLRPLVEDLA